MKTQLLDEIIACLANEQKHWHYFSGAYASRLLAILLPKQAELHKVKQTRFKRLLDHKTVKPIIAQCGNGILERHHLETVWPHLPLPFVLSIGRWGGKQDRAWHQTSRFGENLVLQLNLPLDSQRKFKQWIDPTGHSTLNGHWTPHPVQMRENNTRFRETLAWSRIDLDFKHNEALIEEIQSDSVRYVRNWSARYRACFCKRCQLRLQYVFWFESYAKIWSEAMLFASIEFIKNELGINRIFMHTARSGWQVKKMDKDWHAPRSLYSDLPKRFAFKRTWAAPEFLLETKCYQKLIRKQPDIDFYQLSMNELKETNIVTEALCPTLTKAA